MSSFGGVGLSKGRGFGRGITALGLQKPVASNTTASSTPRDTSNDDDWDDTGATSTNNAWAPAASNNSSSGGWAAGQGKSNDNTWSEDTRDTSNNNSWGDGGKSGSTRRGGSSCFKCGKEGHMSRECPEATNTRSNACFNCGQEGHRSSDCTEPRKPRGGGGACFNCGQEGHRSSDCTEPRKPRDGGGDRACFNCGQDGHRSSDCTEPKKSRACFKCNEEGHMSRDCPNPDSNKSSRACRKCGEEGHMARECPSASNEPQKCFKCQKEGHMSRECPNSDASSTACFKCKEEGHMSRECPNPDTREGAEGKPKSTYVPLEITSENEIFNINPTGINFSNYSAIPVKATGHNCPPHINSFEEANFRPTLNKNIAKAKYTTPTPVQKYTIPILCAKRDLMACAQTGSGKTAAFLLPIIDTMFKADNLPGLGVYEPWAVIISPTRELAIQIYQEAVKFSYDSIVKPAILYGGTAVGVQASRLSKGCHILVATTGRLIQFVNEGKILFSQLHYLVLDEADRLLDMGFKGDIEKLVNHPSMPPKGERQTLMFSATFPREVQQLATDFLDEHYIFLEVGIVGAANADVEQVFYQVGQFEKRQKLLDLLNEFGSDKTLVFVELKRNTDFNASFLSLNDIKATSIHGDREQREREEALNDFKSGKMKVLVATAVAARGLDITGVRHVINYDMPKEVDEYVHRIGRTGRVGNTGRATSFFDPEKDGHLAGNLLRILKDANQTVPDWLEEASRSGYSGGGGGRRFGNRDIRQNQSVTSSSFGGDEENWGASTPATNATVVEEDAWD